MSDLASAIELVPALLSTESVGRVLLISDGNQTLGDARAAAEGLAREGIELWCLPAGPEPAGEVLLESMSAPAWVSPGARVSLRVLLRAASAGEGVIRLQRNGRLVATRELRFPEGSTVLTLEDKLDAEENPPGLVWEATLTARGDVLSANNAVFAYAQTAGERSLLIVDGGQGQADTLTALLRSAGHTVVLAGAAGLPAEPAEWESYSAVLLVDLPASRVSRPAMEGIRRFVHDQGGGLLMVGGPESFGAGGWLGTPVESALPVSMDSRDERGRESLALVLLIDKSGSMAAPSGGGEPKIALAREAARQTAFFLKENDQLAVLAFDTDVREVLPPTPAGERERIDRALSGLAASGGTEAYPALRRAVDLLTPMAATYKHVLLLSDGQTPHLPAYESLLRLAGERAITVSTVGVGPETDEDFLEGIAESGGGRYFAAPDADHLSRIFLQDTLMAYGKLVKEGVFPLEGPGAGWPVEGQDWSAAPPVLGYVRTGLKDRADLLLGIDRGEVLLATWRYGLGKSLAWTSDAGPRWTAAWTRWPGWARFWPRAAAWVSRELAQQRYPTRVVLEDGKLRVLVETVEDSGELAPLEDLSAVVGLPGGASRRLPLEPVAPGASAASCDAPDQGVYTVAVVRDRGSRQDGKGNGGKDGPEATPEPRSEVVGRGHAVRSYAAEYRSLGPDLELLRELAAITGGRVLSAGAEAAVPPAVPLERSTPLADPLVALAAVLLLLDLAFRRLPLPVRKDKALPAAAETSGTEPAAPPSTSASMDRLLEAKRKVQP